MSQGVGFNLAVTEGAILACAGLERTFHSYLLGNAHCSSCCCVIRKGDLIVRGQYRTYGVSFGSFCDDCVERALEIFYTGCLPCTTGDNAMASTVDPMRRDSTEVHEPNRHNYDNLFLGDYLRP